MAGSFPHRHLLDIERLSVADIETILDLAERYAEQNGAGGIAAKLKGKTVVNLFYEPSTRTRTSFEIAAKRLGADVINIPIEHSSARKGETLLDTALVLDAMHIGALVIRHAEDGVPQFVAPQVKASVINAGDGAHEHPTQALADALVMRRRKKTLKGLTVAICGDIAHSRVARSNVHLLNKFGAEVRLIAPACFKPEDRAMPGAALFEDMETGLKGADAVMMLRIQRERLAEGHAAPDDYVARYGLDHKKLAAAKKDAIVMHPGPVNRGVEIMGELADDPARSVILEQVEAGVAVRMAVLDLLLA